MKFEKDNILAQLEKIASDKSFSRSKIKLRLLRFLVESTLENEDIKETTIGTKFFGSKYDPIKYDNKVRVYIYHLRKKLDEYYRTTASSNEIVFSIAKGQYKVRFEEYGQQPGQVKKLKYRLYVVAAFLFGGIILTLNFKKTVNVFWKDLMGNDFLTTVIFGDYFTIETTVATGGEGIIRDYEINSENELQEFINKHPEHEGELHASQHHYFNWMAPYCSRSMAEYFGKHQYPYDIIQISEWSVSKLERENLVYFGQSKSMGLLKNILVESFPNYTFRSQLLERTDPETRSTTIYSDVADFEDKIIDYTVVAKISMPTGNEMRFFLSDQDCGAISAIQYFTENDSVKTFYERHNLSEEEDFLALFKVTGWHRKSYEMEFILLDKK